MLVRPAIWRCVKLYSAEPQEPYTKGPLGLGRFAKDHSQTKAAPRLAFVLRASKVLMKISYSKSACMISPFNRGWEQINKNV